MLFGAMGDLFRLMWCLAAGLLRSCKAALYAEVLVLRHQLNVLQCKSPKRHAIVATEPFPVLSEHSMFDNSPSLDCQDVIGISARQ